MSAKLCGCDLEQDYVCEQHRTEPQGYGNVYERAVANNDWYREHVTKTAENLMAMQPAREATPIEESLIDVQRHAHALVDETLSLAHRVEALQEELQHALARRDELAGEMNTVVAVLSDFVHAPISLSSLQPILNLAYVLNPSLKERR